MKDFTLTSFNDFGLAAPILQALTREGYETPTPIQAQAIPPILLGHDLLGTAQTGTGKTAAFALPILDRLLANPGMPPRRGARVLVLSPTRELASQIAQSFRTYGSFTKLSISTVFGGVPHGPQIKALARGLDVLVATPGRLVDHLESGSASLSHTEFLVLDEVDQMLDLGFIHAIRRIVKLLPQRRQNLFFSATMPKEIGKLAAELLTDPVSVSVAPVSTTVERVQQHVIHVEASRKRDILVDLFADAKMSRTIVFTRTKHGADKVARHLELAGITSAAIHGNKSQGQRERSLYAFRSGQVRALVATDIAARGIDIDSVTHVINHDLPEVPESYVHRIGRTARAGSEGIAISLVDREERDLLSRIEKLIRMRLPSEDKRSGDAPSGRYDDGASRPSAGRGNYAGQSRSNDSRNESRGHESRGGENRSWASRNTSRPNQPRGEQYQGGQNQGGQNQGGQYQGGFNRQDNAPRDAQATGRGDRDFNANATPRTADRRDGFNAGEQAPRPQQAARPPFRGARPAHQQHAPRDAAPRNTYAGEARSEPRGEISDVNFMAKPAQGPRRPNRGPNTGQNPGSNYQGGQPQRRSFRQG